MIPAAPGGRVQQSDVFLLLFYDTDMTRERLQGWFDFFVSLNSHGRLELFGGVWDILSNEEQDDVVQDLKALFVSGLAEIDPATLGAALSASEEDEDV